MTNSEPEDYLWDGAGTPDAEVARLEELVGRYGLRQPLRALPALEPRRWWEPLIWSPGVRVGAFAAVVLLVLLAAAPWAIRRLAEPDALCQVRALVGEPRVDGRPLPARSALAAGGLVETGAASQAEVRIGLVGHVTVYPD